MFSLKNNNVRRRDISIPMVEFDKDSIGLELGELFKTNQNIYYYMGLVFLRLGFEPEDNVVLSNYDKTNNSFDCIVNDMDVYKIRIASDYSEIVVNKNNYEYGYVCENYSIGEIGMKISLGRYSIRYPNGIIFTRCLSRDKVIFKVEFANYAFELELDKPDNLDLPLFENGCYAKYRLDNEEELIEYLCSLKETDSITEIYKEICNTYIGTVLEYPKFSLKKSKFMEDGKLKTTDLISLNNGDLDKFGMTVDGITVFLDGDDNWLFEMPAVSDVPVDFSMTSLGGKINCTFSFDKKYDLKKYTDEIITSDIDIAFGEVEHVKKRVRELFNNVRGSK